jgi:hypothetical protein
MPSFIINIPIRAVDAEDVKNAFAYSYGYSSTVEIGGVTVANPISKEEFVQQKCVNFMLDIVKMHLVKTEELAARTAANEAAQARATEVGQWFDDRRIESIGGSAIFENFPSIDNQSVITNKNSSLIVTLTGTDPENLPLTFEITAQPSFGTLEGVSPDYVYVPNPGFYGSDLFKFKANNGTKNSLEGTIDITVHRTITAHPQSITLNKNNSADITLTCSDNLGPTLIYTIIGQPLNGVLIGTAPDLVYTPNQDFVGTDSFTFRASDDSIDSNITAFDITIYDTTIYDTQG